MKKNCSFLVFGQHRETQDLYSAFVAVATEGVGVFIIIGSLGLVVKRLFEIFFNFFSMSFESERIDVLALLFNC